MLGMRSLYYHLSISSSVPSHLAEKCDKSGDNEKRQKVANKIKTFFRLFSQQQYTWARSDHQEGE